MNKTELVKRVAEENELTQKAAAAAVDSVLSAIQDTLVAGETVSLLGFGTLSIKHRDARQGPRGYGICRKQHSGFQSRQSI